MNGIRYSLALAALCFMPALRAQTSNIIVFSEAGEKFTLLVDGDQRNEAPATRVEAKGIKNATPLLVVNFADPSLPSIRQNGYMEAGQEYTLRITTNKKGQRVLRPQGQTPLSAAGEPAAKPAPAQFTDDAPATKGEVIATDGPSGTTTTTTTTVTEGGPGNVNMSIGVNGMGINMHVNDGTGGTTTTSSTTTTTTTSTTTGTSRTSPHVHEHGADRTEAAVGGACRSAMPAAEFDKAKGSIQAKGFDETKLTLAKQIAGGNCLTSEQVKAVMGLFGFEDNKLDFAKFAYDRVYDQGNFYKVNDAFSFSSSVDELNTYIQGR